MLSRTWAVVGLYVGEGGSRGWKIWVKVVFAFFKGQFRGWKEFMKNGRVVRWGRDKTVWQSEIKVVQVYDELDALIERIICDKVGDLTINEYAFEKS